MSTQYLLADIGLRTDTAFLGTTVVDVAVDVAVLLVLGYHFSRYHPAALAATHNAAQRLRLILGLVSLSAA
ncbi:MAG: hypothetical protein WAN50_03265 [Minisyncoccia bacterium]